MEFPDSVQVKKYHYITFQKFGSVALNLHKRVYDDVI